MGVVIAVANQKGGVAKTTTAHALAEAWALDGHRVLLMDLDPQACLTWSCGLDPDSLSPSLHDVLLRRASLAEVLVTIQGSAAFDLVPATIDLAGAEVHLVTQAGREMAIAKALEPLRDHYDYIVLDCPPSLGILTINGLSAADAVVIPLQCEALSHRGVGQLLDTVADVKAFANAGLQVLGVVATIFDGRTRLSREIAAEVGDRYGLRLFEPPVPKSVRFAEAPALRRSILEHAPKSAGALAYRALASEMTEAIKADQQWSSADHD